MLNHINNIINQNVFTGIYIGGYFDQNDEEAQFYGDTSTIYLEFEEFYLRLTKIDEKGSCSQLGISGVSQIDIYQKIEDEDIIPCRSRVENILFSNPLATNLVKRITYYNMKIMLGFILCDAFEIELENGQLLFFDPRFLEINIGDSVGKRVWEENLLEDEIMIENSFDFEI